MAAIIPWKQSQLINQTSRLFYSYPYDIMSPMHQQIKITHFQDDNNNTG